MVPTVLTSRGGKREVSGDLSGLDLADSPTEVEKLIILKFYR
jgi:hypothetical protein